MEREVLLGPDQPSMRTTSGGGAFLPENFHADHKRPIYFSTEISEKLVYWKAPYVIPDALKR